MSTPRVTLAMLERPLACASARDVFRREWPEGAEVTVANVLRAQELGLLVDWGTRWWFTREAGKTYYEAVTAAKSASQEAERGPASTLQKHQFAAYKEYKRVLDGAELFAPAERVYREAVARAWVDAFVASWPEIERRSS